MDFRHVLGPIEGRFVSGPDAVKRLVSFAAITVSLTHPGMYFAWACLVLSGACLSIRVDNVVSFHFLQCQSPLKEAWEKFEQDLYFEQRM